MRHLITLFPFEFLEEHTEADVLLSPHRGGSKNKLTLYLRGLQIWKRVRRKPEDKALKNYPRNCAMTSNNRLPKSVNSISFDALRKYVVDFRA